MACIFWSSPAAVCFLLFATPGPIEAASNTETTVMQAVQAAIIAAAAEEAEAQTAAANADTAGSSDGDDRQQSLGPLCLDRTERLANSLGKMAATVQQLNEIPHECSIMLMAGKEGEEGVMVRQRVCVTAAAGW